MKIKVEDKLNEITVILKILDRLDIDGCIITMDAIWTQTGIMDKIIKKVEILYYQWKWMMKELIKKQ